MKYIRVCVYTHTSRTHNTRIRIIKHFILAKHLSCRHIPHADATELSVEKHHTDCKKDFGRWNVKSMSVSSVSVTKSSECCQNMTKLFLPTGAEHFYT